MTPSLAPTITHTYVRTITDLMISRIRNNKNSKNKNRNNSDHNNVQQRPIIPIIAIPMKSSSISTSRWENKEKHNDTALPMSSSSDHRVTYSPQSIELDSESDPESSELESEMESDLESDWASSDEEEVSYFASKMTIPSKQQNTAALLRLHSTSTLSTSTAQRKRQQKFSTTSSRLSIPPPPPLTPRHSSLPSLSTQTQITSSTSKNHQWRASTSSPTPIKVNNNRKKNKKKKKEKKKEKKKKNVNWNKNVHVVIIPNLKQYTRTEKLNTYYSPNDYTEIENECDVTSSYMDNIIIKHKQQQQNKIIEEDNEDDDDSDDDNDDDIDNGEVNNSKPTTKATATNATSDNATNTSPTSPNNTNSPCRLFLKFSKLLPSGFCSRGLESWTIDGEEWKEYRVELVIDTVWQAQMDTVALNKSKNRDISVSGVGGDVCGGGGVGVGRGDDDKISISSSNNNNVGVGVACAGSSLDYYCNTTSWNRSSWNCEDEYIRQQSTKESLPSIIRAQQIALQDEKDIQSYLNSVRSLEKSRKRYITNSISSRSLTRTKTKMTTRIATSSVGISSSSSIGSSPTSLAVVTTGTKAMLKSIMKHSGRNKPTRSKSNPSFSSHIQRVKPTRRTTATTSITTSKGPPRLPERFASPTSSKPHINLDIIDDNSNGSNDNNKNSINNAVSRGEGGGETHSLRNVTDIDGDNSNSNNNSKSTRNSNSNSNSSRCSIRSNGSNVVENNNKMKKIHFIPKSKTKIPTSPVSSLYGSISSLSNGDNNNDKNKKSIKSSRNNTNNDDDSDDDDDDSYSLHRMMRSHMSVASDESTRRRRLRTAALQSPTLPL